jgi:hypothetical protein
MTFETLAKMVYASDTERGQVNACARGLVRAGMSATKASKPEVHEVHVDRSALRIYVWRGTPFGEPVILATGPSFEPKLALASMVPAEPGVGVYVQAAVRGDVKALSGAGRAAEREERGSSPAKRASKPRAPRAKKAKASGWHSAPMMERGAPTPVHSGRKPVRVLGRGDAEGQTWGRGSNYRPGMSYGVSGEVSRRGATRRGAEGGDAWEGPREEHARKSKKAASSERDELRSMLAALLG